MTQKLFERFSSVGSAFDKPEDKPVRFAGFWVRNWAVFIDTLIILTAAVIIGAIVGMMIDTKTAGEQFSMWVMDFLAQKLQGIQSMPMGNQEQMQSALGESLNKLDASFMNVYLPLQAVFSIFYYAIPESSRMQGSLGKYFMKIKITDLKGERISFWRALGRNLSKIVPEYFGFLPSIIIYLTIPFDKRKRGLHDMLCKTYVVYR